MHEMLQNGRKSDKKNLQRNEITQKKQKSEKYNELPEILKKKKNFMSCFSYKLRMIKNGIKNNLKLTVQIAKSLSIFLAQVFV